MNDRITAIIERWFLQEPALFCAVCTHDIVENSDITCPMRIGRRKIEYNPELCSLLNDEKLEATIMIEAIRILLKHPYERKPDGCEDKAIAVGSNLTIGDNYRKAKVYIERPENLNLECGRTYEWYCVKVQESLSRPLTGIDPCSGDGDATEKAKTLADKNSDVVELWEEDAMMQALINNQINNIKEWGSLAGAFAEKLIASTNGKINWKDVFSGFRASILSSKRKLTRMRPNRRTGFENMGSIRKFDTSVLIAVDVCGSISTETLKHFYCVINSAFRYGFETVDVIQFDCGVRVVQSVRKKLQNVTAIGRGGTSFEVPIQYAHENGYEGMVILTDGYAPEPQLPEGFQTKLLWVCEDRQCFDKHHSWMEKSGRVCIMDIN